MTPQELEAIRSSGDPYALGCKPSGVTTKDYVAALKAGATPAGWTHSAYKKVPVKNQQGNTCVGNSVGLCMTYLEWVEKGEVVTFDGEQINMRVVGKDYGTGAAATGHDILDDVTKHGAATPGGLYFPQGYAWVDVHDVEAIKVAMTTPHVMLTAATWLTSNWSGDGSKSLIHEMPGENPWGLHMITPIGYDANGLLIQNSWGTWWGSGGFARLGWDFVAARFEEMWAVTDNSDTVSGGFVKTYDYGTDATERAVKHADTATRKRPAVYLVKNNGRIWITDPFQAKRFGVDLAKVEVLADTDLVWALPVIGPDAAPNLR